MTGNLHWWHWQLAWHWGGDFEATPIRTIALLPLLVSASTNSDHHHTQQVCREGGIDIFQKEAYPVAGGRGDENCQPPIFFCPSEAKHASKCTQIMHPLSSNLCEAFKVKNWVSLAGWASIGPILSNPLERFVEAEELHQQHVVRTTARQLLLLPLAPPTVILLSSANTNTCM